jgi:hypothetical protein
MRKFLLSAVLIMSFISFQSCSNTNGKTADKSDSSHGDTTMYDETRPGGNFNLEDLLVIKNEADLKQKFGADHVKYDTIWGMEGSFDMGSYLDKGTKDEVQIMWKDSLHRSEISGAMITAPTTDGDKYSFDNKWQSSSGVKLGMTTDELEKLNGKSFSFSGFDWDYGGGVMGWNGGRLDKQGVSVTLTEGNSWTTVSEKEAESIMGDQTVSSDNAIVKKLQPKVVQLSVYQPE